jgi:hypothetical protein
MDVIEANGKSSDNRAFLIDIAKKLNVKNVEDWYQVTAEDLKKEGVYYAVERRFGSLNKGSLKESGDYIGDCIRDCIGDRIGDPCFFCSPRTAWTTEETWISNTI